MFDAAEVSHSHWIRLEVIPSKLANVDNVLELLIDVLWPRKLGNGLVDSESEMRISLSLASMTNM